MTLSELEKIEQRAQRGQADPQTILRLAAFVRNALQERENVVAIAQHFAAKLEAYGRKQTTTFESITVGRVGSSDDDKAGRG